MDGASHGFREIAPGSLGVVVRWATEHPASGFVVLRSARPIADHEQEALYAGALDRELERWPLPPERDLLVDRDARKAPGPLWYAVLALAAPPHPLRVVAPTLQAIEGPVIDPYAPLPVAHHAHDGASPLEAPPALTFLDDDPKAAAAIAAMAKALSGRP